MTPLAIHQWGWSQEDALAYLGIIMAVGGVLSGLCFATIGPLAKIFDERALLLFAGITPMIIGRVIMFPMGSEYPNMYDWNFLNNTANNTAEPETRGIVYSKSITYLTNDANARKIVQPYFFSFEEISKNPLNHSDISCG